MLVEFALSLPILLFIVVGILDFGFLFHKQQVVTNAAREGARMAALGPHYTEADVRNRVLQYLTAGGVTETPTTPPTVEIIPITPASGGPFSAARVTVTLTHTFAYLGPIATLIGGSFGTANLVGRSVMRMEVAAGP